VEEAVGAALEDGWWTADLLAAQPTPAGRGGPRREAKAVVVATTTEMTEAIVAALYERAPANQEK